MNADLTALCRRLLDRVLSDTTDESDAPYFEPSQSFTDAAHHRAEREQFFLNTPQVVGFAGEVARANSYKAVTVLDKPILICRNANGELRAFINACQHRGAQIAEGVGCGKSLSCPFHGWTYDLDGKLKGRRKEAAFAGDSNNTKYTELTALPVSDSGGMLTVGLTPTMNQQTVDAFLTDIERPLQNFDFNSMQSVDTRRFDVNANWKLVVGLSNEGYHFENLHRNSLAPMMSSHGVVDYYGRHTRWAFALKSIRDLENTPEHDWPEDFPGAINHTLFPGTVIVAVPGAAQMIRAEPGRLPGTSTVYYSGVFSGSEDPAVNEQLRQSVTESFDFGEQIFVDEDLNAAAQCQLGIAAGGLSGITVGRNEPLIAYWHQLWNDKLDQHPSGVTD
ncbi:MAG: aromatic ring-hydroxylating dioxygenase subunit alpha [Pseudomonadales bacterium]